MGNTTNFINTVQSWGRTPQVKHSQFNKIPWKTDILRYMQNTPAPLLPYGLGRSYGDSCLNENGALLSTALLDHLIDFNPTTGILSCEAGVTLKQILDFVVPRGWFLPVTPGTQFVTLGGAIANDVHGKNHHARGTFGNFVLDFELVRSDQGILSCSPTKNPELFSATIGGLGLTGIITQARIQLVPVKNAYIDQEVIKFKNLSEFFEINHASETSFEHTVAWVDCMARGKNLGRGHYIRGNYAQTTPSKLFSPKNPKTIPIDFPSWALNSISIHAFNELYYHRLIKKFTKSITHYHSFFYPLDSIHEWNRIYGKRGFYQYQCVVPFDQGGGSSQAIQKILETIAHSRAGSFLAVLKTFGSIRSPGLLSFPRHGVTLALDFPNQKIETETLFKSLDQIVMHSGGAIYPAKDARMSAQGFQAFYPGWKKFKTLMDPKCSSSFWRRVSL